MAINGDVPINSEKRDRPLFSGVFSKHPALSMILPSISEKEMLAINKEGVDFIGIFFYKGVSPSRERK